MSHLMQHIDVLTSKIGPRPVSTEEEHAAACYISQELSELGLAPEMDEFTTPAGGTWPYTVAFLLAEAGTVVSGLTVVPALKHQATALFSIGLVLLVAGLIIYFTEHFDCGLLSAAFNKGVSQNVVAKYVPSSLARERRRRKIIIVAHVDTTRSWVQAGPRLVNLYPKFLNVLFYIMCALPVVFVVRLLPVPWPSRVDFVLWVLACVACLVPLSACVVNFANKFTPYTEGANCNASGVAVMLEVARLVLDPSARERFAKEDDQVASVQEVQPGQAPVETFAPSATAAIPVVSAAGEGAGTSAGAFGCAAVAAGAGLGAGGAGVAGGEPGATVVAGLQAVQAAGLVPEGAVVEYALDEDVDVVDGDEQEFDPFAPSTTSEAAAHAAVPVMAPVNDPATDQTAESAASKVEPVSDLSALIPVIGSSTTGQLEAVAAQDAVAPASAEPFAPARRVPTARRASENFTPTAAVENRTPSFNGATQTAAVTSAFAPVAPVVAPAAEAASVGATSAFPSLGGTSSFRPVGAPAASDFASVAPAAASGRTAASGGPAASGKPAVASRLAGKFGAARNQAKATSDPSSATAAKAASTAFSAPASIPASSIAAPENFDLFAPEQVQINVPQSRWRDALDGATSAFGRIGRKNKPAKNQRDANFTGSWSMSGEDDDDFGWKGGAYYNPEVHEAARARAAQIRESVIAMTEHDLLNKEVWFVAVGASSANQRGMKNFIELHGSELRGSLILNLEGVGAGELCYVDIEGRGKQQCADRRLQKLVRRVSRSMGEELSAETLKWRNTCATTAQRSGLRAMTLMAFDGVAPLAWRQPSDTADRVEEATLQQTANLVLKMIENA